MLTTFAQGVIELSPTELSVAIILLFMYVLYRVLRALYKKFTPKKTQTKISKSIKSKIEDPKIRRYIRIVLVLGILWSLFLMFEQQLSRLIQ